MSLLGKYTDEENSIRRNPRSGATPDSYVMPAVVRDDDENGAITLKKSLWISIFLHPATIAVIWLILFICTILGIHLTIFDKPTPKTKDIEFVLVDKEATPRDMHTKNRADINSRSGGINNPKLPVSMPSSQSRPSAKPAGGGAPKAAPKPSHQPSIMDRVKQSIAKPQYKAQTTTQKHATPSPVATPAVPKHDLARPQPPTARPSARPPMTPKAISRPSNTPFKVPVPSGGSRAGQYATGPVSGSGSSKNGGSRGSGNYSPNPSLAPIGSGSGSSRGAGHGTGSGYGRGSGGGSGSGSGGGNPGGGGGRPGIDAIREPDFGPYMRELQRRIKMNWDPPKGNESKRVVLLFKIAKDGRLLSCRVFKSSGLQNADAAALNAVKLAAPFRPLPAEFKGQNIDIQFTFDYNVFGASRY